MNPTDWIISISAAGIGIVLSIAAFFAQKWIQSVDETLKEYASDLKALTKQVSSLEQKQVAQAENLSQTIKAELSTVRFPHLKVDEIREEISLIQSTLTDKIVPQQARLQEHFGKIILIENNYNEQNEKLSTMFSALKLLVADVKSLKKTQK